MVTVRSAETRDADAIWSILEPAIRGGETYTLPRDLSRDESLSYWSSDGHEVFVAEKDGAIAGTYYLSANRLGGGSHVANCGYVTSPLFEGRGVARAMCEHSLDRARSLGFRAMQFNFVVSSNERAMRLWQTNGFAIVGTLPEAFLHPSLGFIDAYVMYRKL